MKKTLLLLFFYTQIFAQQKSWVRINQLGYLEKSIKVAVFVSKENTAISQFSIHDALTDKVVFQSKNVKSFGKYGAFSTSYRLNFSDFKSKGGFYIKVGNATSPNFRIANDIYDGTADYLLRYMRQQRSGYNPFLKDSCHREDGFIVYHPDPKKDSTYIDVSGGWHDASDYLQYLPTTANATFQLLFAYKQNPKSFGDKHDAWGNEGKNGIPDILDEAKWGMDWLLKMNPAKNEMYNQLADDRDHMGMRLPTKDTQKYATNKGLARPAYFITGKPQGAFKYQNRTQGVASSAGKFASTFAFGSQILKDFYPEYSQKLIQKAKDAYEFGKQFPGTTQTAPCRAPYFYEEDNFVDDMELAAVQLHDLFNQTDYLADAAQFGKSEPTTPWMGSDTARHYQWYPFLNLGHYFMANQSENISQQFREFKKLGIEKVWQRGKNNPFLHGIPHIWCSNNYVSAMITQCSLYEKTTGDKTYAEMEASLRDWLFGCNPWGTSMICGLPDGGVSPRDPHSAFTHLNHYRIDGGLVDGPIYGSIWSKLIGITLYQPDEFAEFQSNVAVYHDDYGDYSSNEPTMDGTASLTYYLSEMQKLGNQSANKSIDKYGAITRGNEDSKKINLIFTGHEYADGAAIISKTLKKHSVKASFYFTGDFMRQFPQIVKQLKTDGHYVGCHSDKHLLYCDWTKRDSTLISEEQFVADIKANYQELAKFGISKEQAKDFMPPYEWYNQQTVDWAKKLGLNVISFTSGTSSNADYTTPSMKNYLSSDAIYDKILNYEKTNNLNGFNLLLHIGTDPARTDKFYNKLDNLIKELKARGYWF
ncbi:MAG: glycoside hydrolase family 9 protein [Spirosomaceae bacterium]|jgi:peptidoglycan/xylan/chitin deacetylase (PgdA/CDA1 family)|nr:glycoside hydrolase family 9 protein [Spirosomataceae bacterium]